MYRPEDSRWEKVHILTSIYNHFVIIEEFKVGDLQTARDNHAVRVVDGRGGRIHDEGKNWYSKQKMVQLFCKDKFSSNFDKNPVNDVEEFFISVKSSTVC